ncbi:hypothetical protein CHN50_00875 [Priestia aryabhattai]|nr:hypothetical protein CHN50_00875 [Priestia aryabhattai]
MNVERKKHDITKESRPRLMLPEIGQVEKWFKLSQKVNVTQFCTQSDGKKRVYNNKDAVIDHSTSMILDPCYVSYINLFVNGVLQPATLYEVKRGVLILKSADVPAKHVPLILQFIKIEP